MRLLPNIEALAEDVFGLPVRIGTPSTVGGLTDAMALPQYATAIGLVLFGANDERDAADTATPARRIARAPRAEMVVGSMELKPRKPRRKRVAARPDRAGGNACRGGRRTRTGGAEVAARRLDRRITTVDRAERRVDPAKRRRLFLL